VHGVEVSEQADPLLLVLHPVADQLVLVLQERLKRGIQVQARRRARA
jgi:hypothetical protein